MTEHDRHPVDGAVLAADRRRAREERRAHRVRRERRRTAAIVIVAVLAVAVLVTWRFAKPATASESVLSSNRPSASSAQPKPSGGEISAASDEPVVEEAAPTPIFAAYRSLQLRLPVRTLDLTEVAFHQASYSWAKPMTTQLTNADLGSSNKQRGTGREKQDLSGISAVLEGQCLRLWRSGRPGKPDTAADVGAAPGSEVVSPVNGEVTLVRAYKLYGKYDDWEIHIRPNGWAEADVVLIHIEEPTVAKGDKVLAGITSIGTVRKLSDKERLQLGDYVVGGGGDHVHMQINQGDDPRYLESLQKHLREGS